MDLIATRKETDYEHNNSCACCNHSLHLRVANSLQDDIARVGGNFSGVGDFSVRPCAVRLRLKCTFLDCLNKREQVS